MQQGSKTCFPTQNHSVIDLGDQAQCSKVSPSAPVHHKIKIQTKFSPYFFPSPASRSAWQADSSSQRDALFEFPSVNNIKAEPLLQLQAHTTIPSSGAFSSFQDAFTTVPGETGLCQLSCKSAICTKPPECQSQDVPALSRCII